MLNLKIFGSRLKQERKKIGKNQTELAKLTHVSIGSQCGYETGARAPDANYLFLAHEAGINIHYLVTGKDIKSDWETVNWEAHDSILFAIDDWLEKNQRTLTFSKKMDLLRLFLKRLQSKEIDISFIIETLEVAA